VTHSFCLSVCVCAWLSKVHVVGLRQNTIVFNSFVNEIKIVVSQIGNSNNVT
jgi:hypothetical protein